MKRLLPFLLCGTLCAQPQPILYDPSATPPSNLTVPVYNAAGETFGFVLVKDISFGWSSGIIPFIDSAGTLKSGDEYPDTFKSMFWDENNRRMGINVASPAQELHVVSGDGGNGDMRLQSADGNIADFFAGTNGTGFSGFFVYGPNDFVIGVAGFERIRATTTGNFGIGATPTEKLDVRGNIYSTGSIILEGATADGFETTLTATDPTADRTVTFQNASGTVAYTADIPASGGAAFTPTLVDHGGNLLGSQTNLRAVYSRAGNSVTVMGWMTFNVDSTGGVNIGIPLPVASNFADDSTLAGIFYFSGPTSSTNTVVNDASTDDARIIFTATSTGDYDVIYSFTYIVQ